MRTFSVQTRIDIARPAADVFNFVADQTNAPQWQKGLHEVRRTTPGPIGVGTEHSVCAPLRRDEVESRNRFTSYEPGRFVSFEIPAGRITGEASYLAEPTGINTSRLTSEVHFWVSGLAGLAAPLLAWVFKRDNARDEAALKELFEQRGT